MQVMEQFKCQKKKERGNVIEKEKSFGIEIGTYKIYGQLFGYAQRVQNQT